MVWFYDRTGSRVIFPALLSGAFRVCPVVVTCKVYDDYDPPGSRMAIGHLLLHLRLHSTRKVHQLFMFTNNVPSNLKSRPTTHGSQVTCPTNFMCRESLDCKMQRLLPKGATRFPIWSTGAPDLINGSELFSTLHKFTLVLCVGIRVHSTTLITLSREGKKTLRSLYWCPVFAVYHTLASCVSPCASKPLSRLHVAQVSTWAL